MTKLKTTFRIALSLGLGGAAALLGVSVAEARPRQHLYEKMAAYDTNRDGTLDDAERAAMKRDFQALRAARRKEALARWDADRDGRLDDAERTRMRQDRLRERFQRIDANGDGMISYAELEAHAKTKAGRGPHGGRGR